MTARSCTVSLGALAAAIPSRAKSRSAEIRIGHLSAASRPAWAALATGTRTLLQMLPSSRARWTNTDGTPTNEFYKLVADVIRYLDNMRGMTIPQIVGDVSATQAQVTGVESSVATAVNVVNAAADAINTTTQVVQNNGLSGATAIPVVPFIDLRHG